MLDFSQRKILAIKNPFKRFLVFGLKLIKLSIFLRVACLIPACGEADKISLYPQVEKQTEFENSYTTNKWGKWKLRRCK